MKYLNPDNVSKILKGAIANKKPFSMVRLGDGEWSIVKYPKFTNEKICKSRIGRWFDVRKITHKQIVSIRNQIIGACQTADILGIPSVREQRLYSKWKKFNNLCLFYEIFKPRQRYYHFYHVKQLNFKSILENTDIIYCITCRDIGKQMEKAFNLKRAEMFLIPPERFSYSKKANRNVDWKGEPHYPNLFVKIIQWLDSFDLKGKVFLIGAGGLGKSYCLQIKKRGGVAIDIGALFDAWAGLYTRPYLQNPERLKLK